MLKRLLSILTLSFTLATAIGLAERQGPPPDPGCYPNGCQTGNVK